MYPEDTTKESKGRVRLSTTTRALAVVGSARSTVVAMAEDLARSMLEDFKLEKKGGRLDCFT